VDGQEQLVLFMGDGPVGLDPSNGELLLTHPLDDVFFRGSKELLTLKHGQNNSTPVWGESNLLFISTGYSGSRALHLTRRGDKTLAYELWFSNRLRIHFGNAIRLGNYIYGSSGDFGPAFLTAVNIKTGEVAWQHRTFGRASMIYADGKLIVLDEEGNLVLGTVSSVGPKVLARAAVLTYNAWTAPSLVGTRLYIRDRKMIRALDLR
jgi:hypothetical protein